METITELLPVVALNSATEILQTNRSRTEKALIVGNKILTEWEAAQNIEDEETKMKVLRQLDERSNSYLVRCGDALKSQKEARMGVTRAMDDIKKMFTEIENNIDKSKPNTVPAKVQEYRDGLAYEIAKSEKKKREAAEKAAAKKKEAVDIRYRLLTELDEFLNAHLLEQKTKLLTNFNMANIATIKNFEVKIKGYTPAYQMAHFAIFHPSISAEYHYREEIAAMIEEIKSDGKFEQFAAIYKEQMTDLKNDILQKIPSKINELKRIAAAGEDEQKRLLQVKADREAAEAARQAEEAEKAKQAAAAAAEATKQAETTMVLFEQETEIAEVPQQAGQVRQGYNIAVLHAAGYVQIFQYFFEHEGKNLPLDKLGNTKLDQMKSFVEKASHKQGRPCIDSKFLKFEESYKTTAKRS